MSDAVATKGLGQVEGLCACYTKATLNGRPYDEIYKRILRGEDYRFNEMMRRGGILCELGHPNQYTADFERTETDPAEACAIITKIEEKENGKIYATATILDTPKGRIYKALEPFYKFGFSSRGSYDVDETSLEGPNGWNQDTYVFKGFDLVALPANEGSEISAVESLGGERRKIKRKSARESLDLQNIADAANVNPKDVEAELDKLFTPEGEIAPAEYVDVRDIAEEKTSSADITNDTSNVMLDLHKAITDNADLKNQVQKLLFEKAENEASIVSLNSQVADLQSIINDANNKIAFYEQNKKEIQELLDKLLATHDATMQEADVALQEEKKKSASLAAQVAELSQKADDAVGEASDLLDKAEKAEESIAKLAAARESIGNLTSKVKDLEQKLSDANQQLKAANENLAKEKKLSADASAKADGYKKVAISVRESLMDLYSTIYSIDRKALSVKVGKSGDVKVIKSAAESLSKDALRLSGYSGSLSYSAASESAAPSTPFAIHDAVDKELYEGLKKEGKV